MMDFSTELSKRVATGILGATALVLLVLYGGWVGIAVLTAVLSLGMIYEYSVMTLETRDQLEKRYLLLIVTWIVSIANVLAPRAEYELLTFCFLALFTFYLVAAKGREGDEFLAHFRELKYSLFGLLYLVFVPLYLPRIHASPNGPQWTLLFLLIVWTGDTMAYFVGKKYGRRKLYPEISPKKTVEGGLGGLGFGVVVALLSKLIFFKGLSWLGVLFIPLFVGVFAQIGDFCESFLKRAYGKKDSGSLLPGHGGFLDRFDGVVFSLPVMYACIRVFG